jgi:hypothetical protein
MFLQSNNVAITSTGSASTAACSLCLAGTYSTGSGDGWSGGRTVVPIRSSAISHAIFPTCSLSCACVRLIILKSYKPLLCVSVKTLLSPPQMPARVETFALMTQSMSTFALVTQSCISCRVGELCSLQPVCGRVILDGAR